MDSFALTLLAQHCHFIAPHEDCWQVSPGTCQEDCSLPRTFPASDLSLRLSWAGCVLHPPSFPWWIRWDVDSRTVIPQTDQRLMK